MHKKQEGIIAQFSQKFSKKAQHVDQYVKNIFSAVEFGVGLVIMLLQHLLTRTINLNSGGNLTFKFTHGSNNQIFVPKLQWKF